MLAQQPWVQGATQPWVRLSVLPPYAQPEQALLVLEPSPQFLVPFLYVAQALLLRAPKPVFQPSVQSPCAKQSAWTILTVSLWRFSAQSQSAEQFLSWALSPFAQWSAWSSAPGLSFRSSIQPQYAKQSYRATQWSIVQEPSPLSSAQFRSECQFPSAL
jgi:hypothetical protein